MRDPTILELTKLAFTGIRLADCIALRCTKQPQVALRLMSQAILHKNYHALGILCGTGIDCNHLLEKCRREFKRRLAGGTK